MSEPEATPKPRKPASSRPWYLNVPYLLTCVAVAGLGFWAGPHLVRWFRYQKIDIVTGERVKVELRGDEAQRGPDDALVTIIEFSDFECPFCARAAPPLFSAADDYPEDVRIIFKHYPLPGHRNAVPAAHAGWAAQRQGKFWELHDWLYEQRGDLSHLPGKLKELDMDRDRFAADIESAETAKAVDDDRRAGALAGISSTPSFYVNGHLYRGVLGTFAWDDIIEAELEAARELLADGIERAHVYEKLMETAKDRGDAKVRHPEIVPADPHQGTP